MATGAAVVGVSEGNLWYFEEKHPKWSSSSHNAIIVHS